MKIAQVQQGTEWTLGIATENGVLLVDKAARVTGLSAPTSLDSVVGALPSSLDILQQLVDHVGRLSVSQQADLLIDSSTAVFGPSVPSFGNIICVGTNYRKHAIESNMPIPEYPVLFNKFRNAIVGNGTDVVLTDNAVQYDYEAELCIVIGRTAKNVAEEDALDYVFGYCNANDISARDLQFRTSQWLLGKTCDGFCPVGPYLATRDEVPNPNSLGIRLYFNGELRQNSNTADMIFNCKEIISYLSRYMTLQPGDLILTGTPEGVILGYPKDSQVWMKPGDSVVVEIDGLGRLENAMTAGGVHVDSKS